MNKDSGFGREVLLGPITLIILWGLVSVGNFVNTTLFPSPWVVFSRLLSLVTSIEFLSDIAITLNRMFLGFSLASFIGILMGIPLGYWKRVYRSIEFIVDFFRSIPATALFPLFLLLFGIGDKAKVAIVVFSCSLVVLVNTVYSVRNRSQLRTIAARLMGASELQILFYVVFPEALPGIFIGLRTSLSLSLVLVIVSEMFIGTTSGLGFKILDEHFRYRIPEMYAILLVVGLLGYFLNLLFYMVERRIVHWTGNKSS